MKKTILGAAVLVALAGQALAADMPARPYTKAPAFVDSIYNWSGFYVGGHVGGSETNERWINAGNTAPFGDLNPGQGFRQRGAGVFGGGQIGYNWQASNYVFGLEGTASAMNVNPADGRRTAPALF